jgi:hypothetical protein
MNIGQFKKFLNDQSCRDDDLIFIEDDTMMSRTVFTCSSFCYDENRHELTMKYTFKTEKKDI